jgi:hypothetical protein
MPISVCEASDNNSNVYYVKGDISSLYAEGTGTALTMTAFIASHNSVDNVDAKICFIPSCKEYPFKTISDGGFERAISKGDIIANKICFIRYNPITKSIILINPSMDKEASISTLKVFNEASFNTMPTVRKRVQSQNGIVEDYIYEDLVSISDLKALEDRLNKLENKFIIGIGEPENVLKNAENGAIFLRIGDTLT